jgi:hypothetical protein
MAATALATFCAHPVRAFAHAVLVTIPTPVLALKVALVVVPVIVFDRGPVPV